MSSGMKMLLVFMGGAAVGAGALALLNRGKLDLDYLKPLASDLLNKGMDLKDAVLSKMEEWQCEQQNEVQEETHANAEKSGQSTQEHVQNLADPDLSA